jgi:hypothetical protein
MSGTAGQQRLSLDFVKNYEVSILNITVQKNEKE